MKERARRFWADHAELSGAADALASRFIGMFKARDPRFCMRAETASAEHATNECVHDS
jgi:hypothetical protein